MSRVETLNSSMIFLLAMIAGAAVGCATPPPTQPAPRQQLYFAIELTQDGHPLGAPQLLGFEGRQVVAEKRTPGASEPDYRLVLRPREVGAGYKVVLELSLPSGNRRGEVALVHGEERRVHLGEATELKLMLLRVDSPEFRALMHLAPSAQRGTI